MFRRIRHLPQLTRLGAFIATGLLVTAVVSVRSARAQVNEGMRHLARQLMPYAEQGVMEAPRRVVLNGESLYLSMGTTRDGVEAVLDYYEARCARTSGHLSESIRALDHADFNQLWAPGARRAASIETVRFGDADGGYVACLDVGETRLTPQEILRRAESMIASGDLSRYGELRYAYVTRGSTGNTRILTVATQGQFNILRLFPDQGDAPGADIPGLARYPSMRRVISAYEDGVPNKLGVYTVRAPAAQVRSWYRDQMAHRGWTVLDLPRDRQLPSEIEARRDRMVAFEKGPETLFLVFDHADGVTSMMSLVAR
ncbi:MAG: hypothetical protein IPF99_39320 [Deltaproteobacteria bacterium]|nr:hypothetical protein [Deltaproteobacteria bacterium]